MPISLSAVASIKSCKYFGVATEQWNRGCTSNSDHASSQPVTGYPMKCSKLLGIHLNVSSDHITNTRYRIAKSDDDLRKTDKIAITDTSLISTGLHKVEFWIFRRLYYKHVFHRSCNSFANGVKRANNAYYQVTLQRWWCGNRRKRDKIKIIFKK
jgi:hypothetical protein